MILQCICHVAKMKAAMSAHSMADVIPFFSVFSVFIISLWIQRFDKTRRKYILYTNKENNIRNIVLVLTFQQLMANKHHRLHDSKFGWEEVWVWSPTKKKIKQTTHRTWTALGPWHAVNKLSLDLFLLVPSSTHQLCCVNSQLASLLPVGILNSVCSICNVCLFIYSVPN